MDEVAISTFNNKFTNYAGSQRGSTVRALVQQVNASNAAKENASKQITLSGVSDISTIDTGAMYTVTIGYSTSGANNGLVNSITISGS